MRTSGFCFIHSLSIATVLPQKARRVRWRPAPAARVLPMQLVFWDEPGCCSRELGAAAPQPGWRKQLPAHIWHWQASVNTGSEAGIWIGKENSVCSVLSASVRGRRSECCTSERRGQDTLPSVCSKEWCLQGNEKCQQLFNCLAHTPMAAGSSHPILIGARCLADDSLSDRR